MQNVSKCMTHNLLPSMHLMLSIIVILGYQTFQLQLLLQILVAFGHAFFTAKMFLPWILFIFV